MVNVDTSAGKLELAREVGADETVEPGEDAAEEIRDLTGGRGAELMEVLELARQGKIRAHVERFPLERVEEAYQRMRDGSLDGRAVICPHG